MAATIAAIAAPAQAGTERPPPDTGAPAVVQRVELQLDNDSFTGIGPRERWYTSGAFLRVHLDAAALPWGDRVVLGVGQQIFTSGAIRRAFPQPWDRPYGAWLFGEVAVVEERGPAAQAVGLAFGVMGPDAGGEAVQNGVHRLLGQRASRGWPWQLEARPGVQLSYAQLHRHDIGKGWDVVTLVGFDAGSILTAARLGVIARWGGRPASPTFPGRPFAGGGGDWQGYAGATLAVVDRNRLIDGPTIGYDNPATPRRLVPALIAGTSVGLAPRWRLQAGVTLQAPDFRVPYPVRHPLHPYGTLALQWER
jgi:lipid A 3-O-deacylase